MKKNTLSLKVSIAGLALLLMSVVSLQAHAGAIFLTGHDPDFHSQTGGAEGPNAAALLQVGLDYVTGGTTNTLSEKFLWVESRIPTPGGHRVGEAGLGVLGLTLGSEYDRANAAELATVDFSAYTAIAVASSFGGLLTRAELDGLISRSADIEAFINAGGGLFAAAECDDCGADLLGASPNLFGYLPISVTSIGVSAPFTLSAFGAGLGLVSSNLQSPTHNAFGLTGGLNVVDTDTAGNAVTLAGNVTIGGGVITPVPEPSILILFALGLLGLGFKQRRLLS